MSVIRQFEWSVNDIVRLKSDAERAALTSECSCSYHVKRTPTYITWSASSLRFACAPPSARRPARQNPSGARGRRRRGRRALPLGPAPRRYGVNLELQCGTDSVKRRACGSSSGDGSIVMNSGNAMYDEAGVPAFTLSRPPVALLVDLDTAASSMYRLEASST